MSDIPPREITQSAHPSDKIRWGVIGAGRIATVFCNAMRFSHTGVLHAVASLEPFLADEDLEPR